MTMSQNEEISNKAVQDYVLWLMNHEKWDWFIKQNLPTDSIKVNEYISKRENNNNVGYDFESYQYTVLSDITSVCIRDVLILS